AGFVIGFVDRTQVKGAKNVKVGDVILGLSSSGFHSNGYSLVRKLVEKENLNPSDKPSFSKETWSEVLLKPTYLYNKKLEPVLTYINALAHITGGGLYENLPRILPETVTAEISESKWQLPELFQWAQKSAGISTRQLLSTFNCGIGMILICSEENAKVVTNHFESDKISIRTLGHITERKSEPVIWIEK
ncbi:MAG: phosphoribosylformylglycinamidine cyclo-ligase, partial [Bacteroidia bacterium]|nr:phosphoribosylformylglycinamidine cyclo-ligase [Bacteroidia bacterium]